ncbi:MAG TPA: TetR/AcrR family transcriptional regulator [Gemmatimonadales bacterium]|nr:TetR/AcrR family transcriptional regulator [Gemmatimonadales bacterium]
MGSRKAGPRPRKAGRKRAGAEKAPSAPITHDDFMAAAARVDPELRRRSELLWEERPQGGRGPKPSLTPEQVVEAAIEIADADGLGAVTMHAVAARLGFTTMALYRYFPSKEALYDAIVDAGMGLPPEPAEPNGNWREEVAGWAHAKREMLCARPWLAELPFVAAPHGPNWMAWLEALTRPLSRIGLTPAEVGQMISVIDGYTRGSSDTSIALARARARGISERDWAAAVGADLGRAIGDPRFPAFAAILTAPSDRHPLTMKEGFEFGLQRVLDGIESYVRAGSLISPPIRMA